MLKLRSLALELTPRCNQQCVYCYNPWRSEPELAAEELSTTAICGLVDRILEQAELQRLTLTGGEPLLRRDLFQIIDHINGRGLPVVLISNGGRIARDTARMLADRDVRYVQITFTGPDAYWHDAHCGEGSFETTSRGVAHLVAAGVPVGGSYLCTRKNAHAAEATMESMYRRGVRSHFAFNRFNPSGCGAEHMEALMPTRSNVLTALEQADRFAAAHDVKVHCTMPIPRCMIDEGDYPRVRFGQCSAGTERGEYAIDPRGRLKLCTLQRCTMGSVLDESLEDLIVGESSARFRASIPLFCEPCPHRAGCLGGCGAAAEWVFGHSAELDPFLAQHVVPDFLRRVIDRSGTSPAADTPPDQSDEGTRPELRVRISLWYDLVYHVLSHLSLPARDASSLFGAAYIRWCDDWFAGRASGHDSEHRILAEDSVKLARLYADSERASLLHAWPLLHDSADDFRRKMRDDFATLAWSSSRRKSLADGIRRGTDSALPDLFRRTLWSELANGYESFHQECVAPVVQSYRGRFTRQLAELAKDLPALKQLDWILSHPLRRHGRLLFPSAAAPVIVVGVADDRLGVSESAPVMQGCHEYFVLKVQAALPVLDCGSPVTGAPGHEAFQALENAALTLGARFFEGGPWEGSHQQWLHHLFPHEPPAETAARLAAGDALPEGIAAAIAGIEG